ncbi:MAG: UDP-3-O-[3-hydroxymyristoyl] N-acetylglucosamine deacetylase, partial [Candidatus Omnitrophica bacterium]|nr:UDP-3-O-[3-hydroxymyristoyl] N-acetylglucosamine deacetylase [Candidatus Omnitrophota bacterium]
MSDEAVSDRQRTIAKEVSLKGAGLHTGRPCTLRVLPAPAQAGILFLRTDLPHRPTIPASACHAVESSSVRRTVLAKDGVEVQTVEHFMSALWGVGVDNAYVEVSSAELPGVDGSAGPFVDLLKSAGVTEQDAPRKVCSPREPMMVEDGESSITVFPDRALQVSYTLSYSHPLVKAQFVSLGYNGGSFEAHVAPARTFCLAEEADALRAQGYGKGANYENTLVIGNGGVIRNTLRFDDEFARHKLLDLLGDLYLLGAHLRARVIAIKSGHP